MDIFFRDYCTRLKISELKAPINLAIACDQMEAAKILLWHDHNSNSKVSWGQLGLPVVHSLWVNDTSSIKFYENLEHLDLRGNNLQSIAPEVFQLPVLNTLMLDVNELEGLPEVAKWTKTLRTLSLCKNRLESLPSSLGSSNVRNLKIQSNRFKTKIPLCVCNLVDLESLDFSDNPDIEALPLEMGKLSKIKSLKFDRKTVSNVSSVIMVLVVTEIADSIKSSASSQRAAGKQICSILPARREFDTFSARRGRQKFFPGRAFFS